MGSRVGDLWDWDQDQDQDRDRVQDWDQDQDQGCGCGCSCGCARSQAGPSSLQQTALGHHWIGDGNPSQDSTMRADCGSVRARLTAQPGAGCGPAAVLCACRGCHVVPCPVLPLSWSSTPACTKRLAWPPSKATSLSRTSTGHFTGS